MAETAERSWSRKVVRGVALSAQFREIHARSFVSDADVDVVLRKRHAEHLLMTGGGAGMQIGQSKFV